MAAQRRVKVGRLSAPLGPSGDFFEQAWQAFEATRSMGDTTAHDQCIAIGGSRLALAFGGKAMQTNVMPALAHLRCGACPSPDWRIAIWDSASTATSLPPTPWLENTLVARGEIQGLEPDAGVEIAWQPGSGQLSMLDRHSRRGMLWMADAGQCPYWEKAAPLRAVLHWILLATQQQLVHAAAVGDNEGAVLLTGKGGSGKSSTALTALLAGMSYLGDDYVLCSTRDQKPRVSSLYNSAKIDARAEQRLPQLAGLLHREEPGQEKAVILTGQHFPDQIATSRDLRAIVVTRVSGNRQSALQPLKAAATFLALAPTTIFQLPRAGSNSTGILRELVSALPCYLLDLGTDTHQIAAVLKRILAANH